TFRSCDIPIGIVATRVASGKIAHDKNISVPNQRYAGLFDLRSSGATLKLTSPPLSLIKDASLGAQLVLPADPLGNIDPSRVFELVEASAAYPVAFAPKVLTYYDAECIANTPNPPGCTVEHHEAFLDGGVFDNYPVSLAVAM